MKLKVLKPHYYEFIYRNVETTYTADKVHGESVVKRGLCEKITETRKRKPKPKRSHLYARFAFGVNRWSLALNTGPP